MGDMIEVLAGVCARLAGRRGVRNRALCAVTCARKPPGHADTADGEGR
jgi:putative resolvase